MKLNPTQCHLSQLTQRLGQIPSQFDLVKLLAREDLSQLPPALAQRAHARLATVLAKQSRRLRKVKSRMLAEAGSTLCAAIKRRQPSSDADRPEREVRERQLPGSAALDFPSRKKEQPEHRFGNFLLGQNALGDLTNQSQARTEAIVALCSMKRLEQFALLNAHQIPGLALDVPKLYVRENLESRTVVVLQTARTRSNATQPTGRTTEKANETVGLA